ncbi:MAG: DUF6989 domain-containing protein [Candidatus Odinarchaeota archaeon]
MFNLAFLNQNEKAFLFIHVAFAVICLFILLFPLDVAIGWRLFIAVVLYNITIPSLALHREYGEWLMLWSFVSILSLFQVIPDWFLSVELNVLVFPEDGFPKIGTVSGYMAGLWTIPLFMIVYLGLAIEERYSEKLANITVAAVSLLIFGLSEETLWILPSWYAQNVLMIDHIAVYILIPEIILGLVTYRGYKYIREKDSRKLWYLAIVAFLTMLIYLGAANFFYFIVEKIIFP